MKKLIEKFIEFIKFISEPSKLVLSFAIILSLLSSVNTLPWSKFRCFISEQASSDKCVQARLEANTALILFLLFLLGTSSLIERYEKFQSIEEKLEGMADDLEESKKLLKTLKDLVTDIDFKKQITHINGSGKWYKTAHNLIEKGNHFVYDASLSSRTWRIDPDKNKEFDEARKRAFKDNAIVTRYLIAIKTYFEKEQFEELIKKMKDEGNECELGEHPI